ncbi:DUF484 domain-containing protein [Xenorhabdus hominickii]|uniref:DUF484 family protein n=1 Tax=Xenorhabdus hominickii TaxID=351679 RepID=A0A2G0QEA0_XENHO|nr:DUF484 domain-containing protein [Xenorhabdus hominickii]AOM41605.1 hypothetical protein A9255_14110 [Xenorhabdus hominickii]PHM57550.1 hypothetical protein Xhom_00525 [Xenorhabdus hominickii]
MGEKDEPLHIEDRLDDQIVVDYLLNNPDFFIRNADMVDKIRVPHPVRECVSLMEWHMNRQRKRIRYLENDLNHLMEQAKQNEVLFSRLLHLLSDLSGAKSLQDFLSCLSLWSKTFGLSNSYIRLFSDKWHLGAPLNSPDLAISRYTFEPVRIKRFGDRNHYLGSLHGPEILLLMPQARHVGSVAISLLGAQGDLGMIIFNSHDKHHYHEGMGTDILDQLAKMLPGLLSRWIERA